ncbi:MAG: T9SS type A sorting domain-containing protein [Chitinophagaceae bacterium]
MFTARVGLLDEVELCSSCSAPKPPVIAHWNFTDSSLVDDANGLTGVRMGGVTPAAGLLGVPNTAFQFDGTSGYIQVPSNTLLDLQSWTLTALVQPQGFYSGTCQGNAIIWRGVQYSSSVYAMIIFDNAMDSDCYTYTPTGEVSAGFPAGFYPGSGSDWLGATPCVTNPCITPGQWYCIWVSYDAPTGKLDVYVDGILRVSLIWPNQYGAPTMDDLFIGSSDNVPGGLYPYYFNGVIDDIAIYGGPLACPLSCDSAENGYARKTMENALAVSGKDIQVVPDPTSNKVDLITPDEWSSGNITILNSVGQIISTGKVNASGKTQINLSNVPAGLYLLRVEGNGKYCVKKVLKN